MKALTDELESGNEAFFGRTTELAVLRNSASSALEQRRPATAAVVGPPGTGKTRLLREAVRGVRAAHHFEVVGHEFERQIPLSAAMSLLRPLAASSARGEDLDRALFGGYRVGSDPLESVRVFELVHRALVVIGPTLLVLDDVQWIDPLSVALCITSFALPMPLTNRSP